MAEVFGVVAGGLTVLELTAKVVKQCKKLIESAHDAPRDLRHILLEVSSLKAVLESFDFLSRPEFSDITQSLAVADGVVEGCRSTVEEISRELDQLSLSNASTVAPGKRQRIKGSLQWCLNESKTRKLLDETMKHKSTLTLALLGEITTDVKQIKSTVNHIEDRLDNDERRTICDWIELINPTAIHHRACDNHEVNTCQWIHRVDQWNDWLSLKRRLLWLHGIPGAGKTVLASYLVEQTIAHCESRNPNRITCLYYYCSFTHGQSHQRNGALPFLSWIVSQLCRRNNLVPSGIVASYRQNNVLTLVGLKEALLQLLMRLETLYIIVDGVDESSPRGDLLQVIQDLATQSRYEKIRLLVTSRRYADIEAVLRPLSDPSLPLSNNVIDEDIRAYVDAAIQRNRNIRQWPESFLDEISDALVQGAQGMFRWTVCQIDRLQRKSYLKAKEAIRSLPGTLEETYETIFLEIPQDDWLTARTALQWILGHSELDFKSPGIPAHCLTSAVLLNDLSTDSKINRNSSDCQDHLFLQELLGCLVEFRFCPSKDDSARESGLGNDDLDRFCGHETVLAHYTIAEFLMSERAKNSRVQYFAMSQDIYAQTMLEIALPKDDRNTSFRSRCSPLFSTYCDVVARLCTPYWEQLLVRMDCLRERHYKFFIERSEDWNSMYDEQLIGIDYRSASEIRYQPSENPTIMNVQYLIAILADNCLALAERLFEKIPFDTLSSVEVPAAMYGGSQTDTWPLLGDILDIFGAYALYHKEVKPLMFLVDLYKKTTDLSELLLYVLTGHVHHFNCISGCCVTQLLQDGADANASGSALSPLQIATNWCDLPAVCTLLTYGANPNSTGQLDGFLPAYLDTAFSQSSPLHILYQKYDLKKERYTKDFLETEALLLQHGATDFVLCGPVED